MNKELDNYKAEQDSLFIEFKDDCYMFNDIASLDKPITKERIKNQLKLIQEELNETVEALEANDNTGLLDGYCDIMVTTIGFGQQLEQLGMNIGEACLETSKNNLSKFIWEEEDSDMSFYLIQQSQRQYLNKGINVTYELNPVYGCYVLKDENNKVRKPINYVSNDVSEYTEGALNYV